jgi:hypothetical protein
VPGGEGFAPGGSPQGAAATALYDPAVSAGPPLPRPRPKLASADGPAAAQGAAKDGKAPETTGSTAASAAPSAPAPVEMHE